MGAENSKIRTNHHQASSSAASGCGGSGGAAAGVSAVGGGGESAAGQHNHNNHPMQNGGGGNNNNNNNNNNNGRSSSSSAALEPIFNQGGGLETGHLSRDLDCYAIRLEPEQSLILYGYFTPKKTLTWRDVLENQKIGLSRCIACGVPISKLHRMQPDIKEWIRGGKATVNDCESMAHWRPNPFTDLGCTIGDLIIYRRVLQPKLLVDSGITFAEMRDRYGLTVELMQFLKYSTEDWINLEIEEEFAMQLGAAEWKKLFGLMTRAELVAQLKRGRERRELMLMKKSSSSSSSSSRQQQQQHGHGGGGGGGGGGSNKTKRR